MRTLFFLIPLISKIKFCTYNLDCKLPNVCCGIEPFKYCCQPKNMRLQYIPITKK